MFNMGMSIGLASGPLVGGLLMDGIGHIGAFTIAALVVFSGMLPIIAIARNDKLRNDGSEENPMEEIE